MSQQDNFSSGFVLGAIVGGVVGGVVGAVVTSQRLTDINEAAGAKSELPEKPKKRRLRGSTEQNMEIARRGLEDKIAQLNDAIDEVRQQLGSVNGRAIEHDALEGKPTRERSIREEP